MQKSNAIKETRQTVQGMKSLVREGQVLIMFAVASLVLVGAVAMAVDVGFLLAERRQVQAAADAAAMAGAQSALNMDTGQIESSAIFYGETNVGTTVGTDGLVIDVDPDADGENAEYDYVEVTITKDVDKYFLGAVYKGDWTVTATAKAAVEPIEADYALITLDDVSTPGILLKGGGKDGGIYITGDNGSAASNSTIEGTNKSRFSVDGAIHAFGDIQGGSNWNAPQGIVPDRNRIVPDPLVDAGIEAPNVPGQKWTQEDVDNCMDTLPCNLNPGRYTDVTIAMENTDTIHLNAGLFYFDGNSSFDLKNKSELTGKGVLLYFTGNASFAPKNGNIDLRATAYVPDDEDEEEDDEETPSVTHDDMVIWVENCTDVDLQGEGEMYFEGIFYAPCSDSWMHGGTGDTIRGQAVLGTLDVRGGSDLRIAYESRVDTFQPSVFLVN